MWGFKRIASFVALVSSVHALAHDQCGRVFDPNEPGKLEIISSGRDQDVSELYRQATIELYGKGGIAEKLGLALPDHQIEFVPSAQLAMLATLGRHAIGHWYDGAQLINAHRSAGVMEFVTPGCPTCRSYYSDTTQPIEQLSILMHVAGHNNFAARSFMSRVRGVDPIHESIELDEIMKEAMQHGSADEVRQWYQHLLSLQYAQDMARGTFEDPSRFTPENAYGKDGRRIPVPRHPTPSVLQAVVANLPASAPLWKRAMATHFERMNRVYSWYASDKIMNEGHATQMQEILAAHSKYNTDEHLIEYAQLFQAVVGRRGTHLDNPYWLGREAWRSLRRRFNEKPENRDLPPLERDKKYLAYANSLIETMHDFDFLRMALDERFIRENKLYLRRKALPHEIDQALPKEKEEDQVQYIVTSRDPQTVVDWIVHEIADRRQSMPSILLESLDASGRSVVSLRHDVFEGLPIKGDSAAQTLFVMSRILEKPVSLRTRVMSQKAAPPRPPTPWWMGGGGPSGPINEFIDVRIEVSGDGKTTVYKPSTADQAETILSELTQTYQEAVNNYRDESMGMLSPDVEGFEAEHFKPFVKTIINQTLTPGMPFLSHAPTASRALLEYAHLLETRMTKAILLLREGKLKFRSTKTGIRIRVMPPIPHFELDMQAKQIIKKQKSDAEGGSSGNWLTRALNTQGMTPESHARDLLISADLGQGDKGVGDKEWGPDDQGGGKGKGKPGDEDGEGDPDRGMGGTSGDPLEVEINFEMLNEILDLELPNRKPRQGGEIDVQDRVREGGTQRPYGDVIWGRVMPTVMSNGKLMLEREWKRKHPGEPLPAKFRRRDVIRQGMRLVSPQDYVVVDHDMTPRPESKALLIRIMDQSGSMHGRPQELVKNFYRNMISLLQQKYKTLDVVNIGFNERHALEMTEAQFFGLFMNGGDYYKHGWDKGYEVATREKYKDYDIYVVTAGDFQSSGAPEVHESLGRLIPLANWSAVIQTTLYGSVAMPDLINPIKARAQTEPWFDYGTLEDSQESQLNLLRAFFSRTRPQKGG